MFLLRRSVRFYCTFSQVYDRDAFEAKVMSDVDREMERRQKEAALERCRKELIDSGKKIAEVT